MMDYKKMAEIVTKEVDAILERKKRRAIIVKRVSLTVSSLCAAAIVGFGVWHNKDLKNSVHYEPDNSIIEDTMITSNEMTTITTLPQTSSSYSTDVTNNKSTRTTTYKTSLIKSEISQTTTIVSTSIENKQAADISSSEKLTETTSIYETISPVVSTTVEDSVIYNDSVKFMKYYSRIIDIGNQSVISDEKNIKVKLDDDYVWYVSLDELEDTDKIKKMGPLHVDFDEYSYVGEYNGEIDEIRHELFYGRKYTHYTYSEENETLYHAYITVYLIEPEKYVMKFENSPNYYLYTLTKRYYEYDSDSSEFDKWSDHGSYPDEIDWNAEVVEVNDNEQLMQLFGTISIGGTKYSIISRYCDISEMDKGLKAEYITFNKKGADNKTYRTEAMLYRFDNDKWIIRFGEKDECWLYSIVE